MPRFFVNDEIDKKYVLKGENARHAIKSLRMTVGEKLVICDGKCMDYHGEIEEIHEDNLVINIENVRENDAEGPVKIHLYQCLAKGDKMDFITQKAVETGVDEITPVISSNCIASMKGKEEKKIDRLNKISLEAAKQCGRGKVPRVNFPINFKEMLVNAKGKKMFFYEKGGERIALQSSEKEISILIGPEGGFTKEEADMAIESGFVAHSLGRRILRAETAGICAVTVIMHEAERKA